MTSVLIAKGFSKEGYEEVLTNPIDSCKEAPVLRINELLEIFEKSEGIETEYKDKFIKIGPTKVYLHGDLEELLGTINAEGVNPEVYTEWHIRLVPHSKESGDLYVINRKKYFPKAKSRAFPVYTDEESFEATIPGLKFNEPAYERQLLESKVFEEIAKTRVLVIGGGTAGAAAIDAANDMGVDNIVFHELPKETVEEHNQVRIGAEFREIGEYKWFAIIKRTLANNPFTRIKYAGQMQMEDDSISEWLNSLDDNESSKKVVVLAADNMYVRARVHQLCKQHEILLLSPADLGNGARVRISDYRDPRTVCIGDKMLEVAKHIKDPIKAITAMSIIGEGGPAGVFLNLPPRLIAAVLARYPHYPRTWNASSMLKGLIGNSILEYALTDKVTPDEYRDKPSRNTNLGVMVKRVSLLWRYIASTLEA